MERTLSPEEKIKRAEEIYLRRKNGYTSRNVATVNVSEEKKKFSLFKKMILQIAICLLIYFIFYLIQNSNYVFSEDVINKTKEILSYDIDIKGMFSQTINGINNWGKTIVPEENFESNQTENIVDTNTVDTMEEDAVGGAELEDVVMESAVLATQDEAEEVTPQTDDEYIKANFSFIKPVEGVVSSEFGIRESDNPIVSKNHTGIDIAANTGTVVKAAMEGTVTISSTTGEYGYHIKIANNDVSTLYAHCSKLYVNEGDYVSRGQEIAEVGSTGKSTGPHLHFEIMRGETYINPRNIIEF